MKKLAFVGLLAVCGFAVASSLNVPWFADSNARGAGVEVAEGDWKTVGFVALHNNKSEPVTCQIDYYAADGTYVNYGTDMVGNPPYHEEWEDEGPDQTGDNFRRYVWSHSYNTFVIAANATVSFRPVKYDPAGSVTIVEDTPYKDPNGQESDAAVVVPNRPIYGKTGQGPSPSQTKKTNGACVITWDGEPTDIQGRYMEIGAGREMAFLLPTGA